MKSNYVTPQVDVKILYYDVITASAVPEGVENFDDRWLED